MSYTNQTTHFGIPLPVQNDLVNLLDWNPSSEAIDAALYGAQQAAETASTDIVGIKATIVQLQNADVQFQSDLNAIDGRVTSLEQTSGGLEDDIEDVADMITAREVPTAQSDQRLLVGEWFRYNGVLYVCTVQIEIGDTIIPNVNCRATNIESEMSSSPTPVGPSEGDVRYNTTTNKQQYYDGTQWVDIPNGGGDMPTLDFANPVKTFGASDTYTTSGDDKYLYVSNLLGDSDRAEVSIDGTPASSSTRNVNMLSNPIVHLKAGQVVTTSSDWNNVNKVYILRAV